VVGIAMVKPEDEVMIITDRGQTIRTPIEGIRETGRNAQGVKLMSIEDEERVVAIEPIGESQAGAALEGDGEAEAESDDGAEDEGESASAPPSEGSEPATSDSESSDDGGQEDR
jgi:DNA gyrase subunit A